MKERSSTIGRMQLSEKEQKIYDTIVEAISLGKDKVTCPSTVKINRVMEIYQLVLDDFPELISLDKRKIGTKLSLLGGHTMMIPSLFSQKERALKEQQLNQSVQKYLSAVEDESPMTPQDQLLCLFHLMQKHIRYDHQEFEKVKRQAEIINVNAHCAYGPLVEGLGVCDGISAGFALVAQRMGFNCGSISGTLLSETGDCVPHGWTLIQLNGKYYHIDMTCAVNFYPDTHFFTYDYFLQDDSTMMGSHQWNRTVIPACNDNTRTYFVRNGCYAKSLSHLDEILTRYQRNNATILRVQVATTVDLTSNPEDFLMKRILPLFGKRGTSTSISLMWNGNTHCFYGKISH